MSTRRCWPPERVLTSVAARSARPTTSSERATICRSVARNRPSQPMRDSRPVATISSAVALTEAESVCRWGT